jgi:hypothetical protein
MENWKNIIMWDLREVYPTKGEHFETLIFFFIAFHDTQLISTRYCGKKNQKICPMFYAQ